MIYFLVQWVVYATAILFSGFLLPGIAIKNFATAMVAAVVLGFFNVVLRPLLLLLTLPLNILTLGLFTLVINALLVLATSALVPGFTVKNFGWGLLYAVVLSVINYFLNKIVFHVF